LEHTVFSYVPNTAEVAFYGMLDGFKKQLNEQKVEQLFRLTQQHRPTREELRAILHNYIRSEKVAIKDIKLRTFITEGNQRNDLAAHVYDITYGSLEPQVDNLGIIDGSITGGDNIILGAAEDAIGIAPTHDVLDTINADLYDETLALIEKIKSGDIVVPDTKATLDEFVAGL
jgi:hypothetical protein